MSVITRAAATAAVLALPLSLAACGSSDDSVSVSSTTSSSATSSSSAPSTSSTSEPAPTSSSTPPPSSTSSSPNSTPTDSPSTEEGKKPTKAAASAGLSKAFKQTEQGKSIDPKLVDRITTCIVDKTYDKLSAKSLNAFVSGDESARLDAKDNTVYLAASKKCGQEEGARQ